MQTVPVEVALLDDLFRNRFVATEGAWLPNCYAILDAGTSTALGRYDAIRHGWRLVREVPHLGDLRPLNAAQRCYVDALTDDAIRLVMAHGVTGSGKTLWALAAGLDAVLNHGSYEAVVLIKPYVSVGPSMGYLPGDVTDKLDPYYAHFYEVLRHLHPHRDGSAMGTIAHFRELGQVEVLPVAYLRGMTLGQRWVVIDEAQNFTRHEMKTILTRIADSSKVVILGDQAQIDVRGLTLEDNGFTRALAAFASETWSATIVLDHVVRGTLAAVAAERL